MTESQTRPEQVTGGDDSVGRVQHAWPRDRVVYLTLDFECDFGTALSENHYEAVDCVPEVVDVLQRADVPLTCFVQTELLDERPAAASLLRQSDTPVEFYPHSHSRRADSAIDEEISTSTARFESFFGEQPAGYRFPNGNVRPSDYSELAAHGYEFDASIFPTWRPGHFNNADEPSQPTYLETYDLYELPFTVLSSYLPVPTALSYSQLVGRSFRTALRQLQPEPIVFNFHLHDVRTPSTVTELSPFYRTLYRRIGNGGQSLQDMLQMLRSMGYSFDTLGNAHQSLRTMQ